MTRSEAGREASILIVEDEGVIGAELGSRLESMGYRVCAQALSGGQAIKAAETHRPDLILMDIRLQGDMDGIDASRVIADRFGIPVVFLTAWYDQEMLDRAKPVMPFGYLVKPVGERELRIAIEMALYAARADAERRAAIRQCRESEQKFRQIMDQAPDALFLTDLDGRFLEVNARACQELGYTREQLLGLRIEDVESGLDLPAIIDEWNKLIPGAIWSLETEHRRADGSTLPVEVSIGRIHFAGRDYMLGFARDISERRQAGELLRLMRFTLETTPLCICWLTSDGYLTYANRAACDITGHTREELVGMHVSRLNPDWTRELRSKNRAERMARGSSTFQTRHRSKDGRVFPIEVTTHFLEFEGREYEASFFQDITSRKQSEKLLRLMDYSLETTAIAIFWMNEAGDFFYVNDAACRSLGYAREELLRMKLADIVPGYRDDVRRINWARRKRRGSLTIESFQCARDGRIFPVKVTSHYLKFEGEEFEFGFVEDITERKKTEEMLRLMRASLESTPASIFWVTPEGRYSYANEAACRGLGYAREELLGMHLSDVFPGWNEDMRRRNQELRKNRGGLTFEAVHKTKDGRIFPVEVTTHCFEFEGREFELAYAVDITQRKNSEAMLRLMRASLETSSACILWITPEGGISYVNEAACRTLGYERDELVGLRLADVVPGWSEEGRRSFRQNIKKSGSYTFERVMRAQNGRMFPVEVTSHFLEFEGKEYEFAYVQDITQRREAEKILHLMQASLETASTSVFWFNPEGGVTYANEAACRSLGYRRTELVGMHLADFDLDWSMERRLKNRELRKKKLLRSFETRYRSRDGRIFPVESTSHYLEFQGQEYEFTFVQDISQRKEAEKILRLMQASLETVSTIILWVDSNGGINYANEATCRILGYSRDELAGMHLADIDPDWTEERRRKNRKARDKSGNRVFERRFRSREGRIFPVEINLHYLEFEGREYEFSFIQDITKRKQAEEALRKAHEVLEERVRERTAELESVNRALFQEVLERKRAEDQLLDYQNRLKAMDAQLARSEERERRRLAADLHDQIGQMLALSQMRLKSLKKAPLSGNYADELEQLSSLMKQMIKTTRSLTFELSPSILFELGLEQALEWLTEHFAERDGLKIDFSCKQCRTFGAEVNITIFRAIQELLMNITKHAPASRVAVALWIENDCQMISVADDGPGFDTSILESKEFNYNRFGLFSLRERLGSIGGRLEIFSEPGRGTHALLRIPIDEAVASA